jgi:hypothetical protein
MPQGPVTSAVALNPSKAAVPLSVDAEGALITAGSANNTTLNITAATVVKATPGLVFRVSVQVAGTGTGTVNDCATTGAAAAANQIYVIPETVGVVAIDWPCLTGIVVTPGTGQTVAISWS